MAIKQVNLLPSPAPVVSSSADLSDGEHVSFEVFISFEDEEDEEEEGKTSLTAEAAVR